MKTFLFFFIVLESAFLLEGSVRHFPLVSIHVDLVWLIVLYLGFFAPLFPGGLWVMMIGLAQETIGAPLHGILSLSYLPIYFFLRLTHRDLFFERGFSQVIWVFLLTVAQKGIEQGLLLWQGYTPTFDLRTLFPTALLEGVVSLALFPFLKRGGNISIRDVT